MIEPELEDFPPDLSLVVQCVTDDGDAEVLDDFEEERKVQIKRTHTAVVREEYSIINNDSIAVQDFHENHAIQAELTFKQKLLQKMTNLSFKVMKNGDGEAKFDSSKGTKASIFGRMYDRASVLEEAVSDLVWLTYRKGFRPLLIERKVFMGRKVENLSTDCGWGCTIRSAQMLLANAFIRAGLHKTAVLELFDDSERNHRHSAFSIQNIAVEGLEAGKLPGDWYGVNTITNVIEVLNVRYSPVPNFSICTFQDSCIIFEKIELAARVKQEEDESEIIGQSAMDMSFDMETTRFNQQQSQAPETWANQVLVIINVRLGVDIIEPLYAQSLKRYVQLPQFAGFIGGQPRKAFFFVGFNDKQSAKYLFLDPHVVHSYVPTKGEENLAKLTSQTQPSVTDLRVIAGTKLDPGIGLSYIIKDANDYESLRSALQNLRDEDGEHCMLELYQTFQEMSQAHDLFRTRSIQSFKSNFFSR